MRFSDQRSSAVPQGTRSRRRVCAAAVATSPTLLGHSTWGIWTALTLAGAAGLWAEQTTWGKQMSGALLSTLAGLALSNLGVIPSESHVYGVVNSYLLPLAVPLLLLSADLRRVLRDTGRLLAAFIAGAASTIAGSFLAFKLLPLRSLLDDGWKVAAALTARHIGGSVNYVAVSETLQLGPAARMAGLAADDLIVSIYFICLYALVRQIPPEQQAVPAEAAAAAAHAGIASGSTEGAAVQSAQQQHAQQQPAHHVQDHRHVTVLHGATAIAVSAAVCFLGTQVAGMLRYRGGAITCITFISVALATAFPRLLAPIVASGEGLATILMQFFFATVGASGSLSTVIRTAPALFVWSLVAVSTHLALCLVFERLFSFTRKETALASNANIGGPTTAAGMAAAKGWRSSMVPALLVGVFGYSTATFVGLGCAVAFKAMQFA